MKTVSQALQKLLTAREKHLLPKTARQLAASLGKVSRRWLDPKNPYHQKALASLVKKSGFSPAMASQIIRSVFSELTEKKLISLLKSELGNIRVLDTFSEGSSGTAPAKARGPRLITHVFSANLPNPAISSLVFGILLKSASAAKVSRRDPGLMPTYLESLKKYEPGIASALYLISAGSQSALRAWIDASEAVAVYGGDETVEHFWKMAGPRKIFSGYGHRISFSIYTRETMNRKTIGSLAKKTALDVWAADQRGCLSPSVLYVQSGGDVAPKELARQIADSLDRLCDAKNSLKIDSSRILAKDHLKNRWKLKMIHRSDAFSLESRRRGEWAVFFDSGETAFPVSCGGQTVFVREFSRLQDVYAQLKPFSGHLQAAAVEASSSGRKEIAQALSLLGVSRVARAGTLQSPPAAWHHDGRPNLADWVRWTDLE